MYLLFFASEKGDGECGLESGVQRCALQSCGEKEARVIDGEEVGDMARLHASNIPISGFEERQEVFPARPSPPIGSAPTKEVNMGIISTSMPLVAAQAGVWDGEYVHLDANHNVIDRHSSRLVCRLFDDEDGKAGMAQTNIYDWAAGTRKNRSIDGLFQRDRAWIDKE